MRPVSEIVTYCKVSTNKEYRIRNYLKAKFFLHDSYSFTSAFGVMTPRMHFEINGNLYVWDSQSLADIERWVRDEFALKKSELGTRTFRGSRRRRRG